MTCAVVRFVKLLNFKPEPSTFKIPYELFKPATADEISDFIEFIKANGGISYAYEVMDKFRSEAYDILESYRNETVKNAIRGYVDFVVSRDK